MLEETPRRGEFDGKPPLANDQGERWKEGGCNAAKGDDASISILKIGKKFLRR